MKKLLTILPVTLFIIHAANAQTRQSAAEKPVTFGINAGLSVANIAYSNSTTGTTSTSNVFNGTAGVFADISLKKLIFLTGGPVLFW